MVWLLDVYDRLFDPTETTVARSDRVQLAVADDGTALLPQILNPDHYAPELRRTTAYANALAIARQLLGEGAEHMGMHAIRKPARHGAETPWHQDEAYWDPAWDHAALSVWLPLQPATLENGCMQFVPGTQSEVVDHRLIAPESEGLVVTDPSSLGRDHVACPLPAGGATVHASRTLHYTGPNSTEEPRRALIMAFRRPPTPRAVPRVFGWQPARWYAESG